MRTRPTHATQQPDPDLPARSGAFHVMSPLTGSSAPHITVRMFPSTMEPSAPAMSDLRRSIPHPMQSLCRSQPLSQMATQHSLDGRYFPYFRRLPPAGSWPLPRASSIAWSHGWQEAARYSPSVRGDLGVIAKLDLITCTTSKSTLRADRRCRGPPDDGHSSHASIAHPGHQFWGRQDYPYDADRVASPNELVRTPALNSATVNECIGRCWPSVLKALSRSVSLLAFTTMTSSPRLRAASCISAR